MGIFRRLHHQCLARDILHQAQGVFYVFFGCPRVSQVIPLYTRCACAGVRIYKRVHDAFHRRFPGPLPVITPFIEKENPRRRRFLSCSPPVIISRFHPSGLQKRGKTVPFFMFCYLHAPKFRVKEQFFIHFHMVFLREALIRRTFALAIGTQAMLALYDTPLGESVWCGGIQTAQLQ